MTSPADVLVVGGGPAGSVVGGLLARRGWQVVILDRERFPRPKPCGECLSPGAVRALGRLGLRDTVESLGPERLVGWDVAVPGGAVAAGRFSPSLAEAWALPRSTLDRSLLEAARRRGARVEEGVRVEDAVPARGGDPPGVWVRDEDGRRTWRTARVIIGADGLRSTVTRRLGAHRRGPRLRKLSLTCHVLGRGPAPDRGRLVLGDGGTLGLAPVGREGMDRLWNATVVVDAPSRGREVAGDPGGFFDRFIGPLVADWERPPRRLGGPWASGPFDWPVRSAVAPGVVLVGDAAGYYDPLTGEGLFRALRSAELAAAHVDRALRKGGVCGGALASYDRSLRRSFRPQRAVQRIVEAVVSRPRVRDAALGRLADARRAMDALVAVTGDARPVRSLVHPTVLVSLLTGR